MRNRKSPYKSFLNFVFKKRLGKKWWSARLIFFIMGILGLFETYINTGDVGRFDHYIPKFLLKKWRISETGTHKGKIYSWSKNTGQIEDESITRVAGDIDWETSSVSGVPSDFISKRIFAELLEDKASSVIEFIDSNSRPNLTLVEENILVVFLANQVTRVPAFRKVLGHFVSLGVSDGLIKREDFGSKNALKNKVALNEIGMTYEKMINNSSIITVDGIKSQTIFLSLIISDLIARPIYKKNRLHILEIPTESTNEFVLSDNPVVCIDFSRMNTLRFIPWWEIDNKDTAILLPISRRKALLYWNSGHNDIPIESHPSLIQLTNFSQYLNCDNKVFSQNKDAVATHLCMFSNELSSR